MSRTGDGAFKRIASNRKALHEYAVEERIEAGIELRGTEVKSIRNGQINLTGAFVRIERNQAVMYGVNVAPYDHGNRFNHPPDRARKLLLHAGEIRRLTVQTEQKGHTIVPLSVYLKRGLVKVELGVCRGKRQADKRETLKRRTADREAERAMARYK